MSDLRAVVLVDDSGARERIDESELMSLAVEQMNRLSTTPVTGFHFVEKHQRSVLIAGDAVDLAARGMWAFEFEGQGTKP